MHAVTLSEHGGTEVLDVQEADRPEPGGHELLVEVEAAGVNPVDTYFREGSYAPVPEDRVVRLPDGVDAAEAGAAGVAHLMETGALSIEIPLTYGLGEADEAQRAVMEDSFLGKLVLEP